MTQMDKIEHFIVLAMENRSFDHMLGYLDHPDDSFEGVKKIEDNHTTMDARYAIYPGPGHSHDDVMEQILGLEHRFLPSYPDDHYEPKMNGFATNYARRAKGRGEKVLRCFNPEMVPVLSTLAREYAVCDHWFCSLPGETFPNRDFFHAGSSFGKVQVSTSLIKEDQRTIYKILDDADKTWGIYTESLCHLSIYNYIRNQWNRRKGHAALLDDIRGNRLPNFAFVEPDYGIEGIGNSQHPSQACSREEFVRGEKFIADIYNALRDNRDVFEKTAFIITYDEHGGFYDHVTPPRAAEPDTQVLYKEGKPEDPTYCFGFRLLGPRVPAVVVSPWIKQHTIDHRVHEHTTIPETVRSRFAKTAKPLSARTSPSLGALFTLAEPRRGADLPEVKPLSEAGAKKLEHDLAAKADDSDDSPEVDIRLQGTMFTLAKLVKSHVEKIGGLDFPAGV